MMALFGFSLVDSGFFCWKNSSIAAIPVVTPAPVKVGGGDERFEFGRESDRWEEFIASRKNASRRFVGWVGGTGDVSREDRAFVLAEEEVYSFEYFVDLLVSASP